MALTDPALSIIAHRHNWKDLDNCHDTARRHPIAVAAFATLVRQNNGVAQIWTQTSREVDMRISLGNHVIGENFDVDVGANEMTDVLKIALERRAALTEEVAKLDEFIRMAETLIRGSQQGQGGVAQGAELTGKQSPRSSEEVVRTAMRRAGEMDEKSAEAPRPSIIRRSAVG